MRKSKDDIEKYIYRHVMSLNDQEKLRSIRELMQDCGASQLTVQKVLRDFEKRQLIVSKNRSGFFRLDGDYNKRMYDELDIVYCTTVEDEDHDTKFHGFFSNYLGKYCGKFWRSVRMHFLEGRFDIDELSRIAGSKKCQACIIVASPSTEVDEIFRNNHVAYVNLFPEGSVLDSNSVNIVIDNEKVVLNQLDHLTSLGHKKIAYMHCLRENETIRDLLQRREFFLRQALERGLPFQPHWLQFGGYDSDEAIEAMKLILSGDDKPTAIIAPDHHVPGIYAVLNDFGFTPGVNFSVVGTDNLSITKFLTPQVSSINIFRKEAVELALKALEKSFQGDTQGRIIPVGNELIVRASTCEAI